MIDFPLEQMIDEGIDVFLELCYENTDIQIRIIPHADRIEIGRR